MDAGGLDNITLELIHIVSSPHSKSVFRRYNPNPTGTNPPPNPRRRYIFGITTIAIVILLLCSLLIFQHKRKVIEEQIATTNAKITEIDSLIILTKDGINKYKKDIEALLIERDAKASKIDDPSQRNEVIKKYDEQCRIIRTDSIDAEEKKKEYERQREELIKTYKKDSIRIEQE